MVRSDRFTIDDAAELYGIDRWGGGYLAVGPDGHLRVTPTREAARAIDVPRMVRELARRGIRTPVLLRFPQLLQAQVETLANAFRRAVNEFGYPREFRPVFPIKVNQQRRVVEALLKAGWKHSLGLEVGSLPELLAAMVLPTSPESVIVCNGYKDRSYLQAAAMATRLGKKTVVVIEKPFEVEQYVALAREAETPPLAGIRLRLQARGSGLWEKSGGTASKFGLRTVDLIRAVDRLAAAGLDRRLKLLHFHIGSQITEIRRVKVAVREGARLFAKVVKRGSDISYLDVGGGLGVDYDGSRTSSDASMNYNVQEYANDVVYTIAEVCEQENVEPPCIISESGRMLTAYHSLLVVDARAAVRGFTKGRAAEIGGAGDPDSAAARVSEMSGNPEGGGAPALGGGVRRSAGDGRSARDGAPGADPGSVGFHGEPQVVRDLREVAANVSVKNYREFYHDALEYRDQLYNAFGLGLLSLEDRARGEELFWVTAQKAVRYSKTAKFVTEEFQELEKQLHEKYICNFSVFQSLPDHYALDQLFPVMPIHRLSERPTVRASLADITCDSEGEVEKFIDVRDVKEALEVHALRPGEPYWLGFFLIGAYQDTMGDLHNLFGRVHEAEVILDPRGEALIRDTWHGDTAGDTLAVLGYPREYLRESLQAAVRKRVNRDALTPEQAERLVTDYLERLSAYTYLD
jgi:arginine decarboxylase